MVRLVLTTTGSGKEGHPPLALGYIASYLRKYLKFNKIKIVDKEPSPVKAILKEKPDIVGISSATVFFNQASQIAKDIKSQLDIPIIIGGPHITSIPYTLSREFDVAVVGEGEQVMLDLIKTYLDYHEFNPNNLKKIKGIAFHENGGVKINERQNLITPLDKIPYPARDLFKMKKEYLVPRLTFTLTRLSRSTHMFTSRGCPYNCVFCSSSSCWQSVRFHSPEYVVGEIKYLMKEYKLTEINIFDDLFTVNKERLRKIVELLESEGVTDKCSFRVSGRANLIDEETCKLMKRMNIVEISIGFESQSPKVLKYLKKGTVTTRQNQRAVDLLKKSNIIDIALSGLFMIGSPYEGKEDLIKTLDFIRNNQFDSLEICVTTALPGTELWEYAKKRNLVSDSMDWSKLHMHPIDGGWGNILLSNKLTREEFVEFCQIFEAELGKRNLSRIKFSDLFSFGLIKIAMRNRGAVVKTVWNILKNNLMRWKK